MPGRFAASSVVDDEAGSCESEVSDVALTAGGDVLTGFDLLKRSRVEARVAGAPSLHAYLSGSHPRGGRLEAPQLGAAARTVEGWIIGQV